MADNDIYIGGPRRFDNPTGVKPQSDTDNPPVKPQLQGATMHTESENKPTMDVSNPARASFLPPENPLVSVMRKYKVPMTRVEFLKLRNAGKSSQAGPEDESEMPERFQLAYPTHEEQEAEEAKKESSKKK